MATKMGETYDELVDVTGVKVDRSLIKEIRTDETSEKIVRKIIELSNDLGICVISEGVED